jgi:hypothetical protein
MAEQWGTHPGEQMQATVSRVFSLWIVSENSQKIPPLSAPPLIRGARGDRHCGMHHNHENRIFFKTIFTLLILILPAPRLHAWARHNLITKYSIDENLKKEEVTVTELSSDESLNPGYVPLYVNPDPARNSVDCTKFVNYDLERGLYYGFAGKGRGEKTNLYDVLVNFSDEPDWGMDKDLNLSFAQKFMAESQGFRHMYYPFWTFHLPYPFVSQGDAPKRAQHFFDRAVEEYRKGNIYNAYRELARSIHYVMDMAQPFHTKQLYYKLIQFSSPFEGTVQTIKNYHFAYETLVANVLQQEDCAGGGKLIENIISAEPVHAERADNLAVVVAIKSSAIAERLIPELLAVLDRRFNSSEPQFLKEEEFYSIIQKENPGLNEITAEALSLTSGAVKGMIQLFEKVR